MSYEIVSIIILLSIRFYCSCPCIVLKLVDCCTSAISLTTFKKERKTIVLRYVMFAFLSRVDVGSYRFVAT